MLFRSTWHVPDVGVSFEPPIDAFTYENSLAVGHSGSSHTVTFLHELLNLSELDNLQPSWKYRLNDDIPELADAYRKIIPTAVQTVCREWCDVVCGFPAGDAEVERGVIEVIPILFHWVAAMGIMGEFEKVPEGLYKLGEWAVRALLSHLYIRLLI